MLACVIVKLNPPGAEAITQASRSDAAPTSEPINRSRAQPRCSAQPSAPVGKPSSIAPHPPAPPPDQRGENKQHPRLNTPAPPAPKKCPPPLMRPDFKREPKQHAHK